MALRWQALFNNASADPLGIGSYSPDTGSVTFANTIGTTNVIGSSVGYAQPSTIDTNAEVSVSPDSSSANHSITVVTDLMSGASSAAFELNVRWNGLLYSSGNKVAYNLYVSNAGYVQLGKNQPGSDAVLDSVTNATYSAATGATWELSATGSTITVKRNGSTLLSVTNTAITAAGKEGFGGSNIRWLQAQGDSDAPATTIGTQPTVGPTQSILTKGLVS